MAQTHNPTFNISGDGDTDTYDMGQTSHKVMIKYGSGVTGSIACKTGVDEDNLIEFTPASGAVTGDSALSWKGLGSWCLRCPATRAPMGSGSTLARCCPSY